MASGGDAFLDTTPKAGPVKEIIDKLDFIDIKNFCSEVQCQQNEKDKTQREKILAKDTAD